MLAPLSPQIQMTRVLSSSPSSSMASMTRPTLWSGVLGEAGVDLHLSGIERLELVGHVVPGGEGLVARRQLRVGRHDTERLLARECLLAQTVPALVELALVLGRPGLGDVVRCVAAARREEGEERLLRVLRPDPVQPLDGLVSHRVRQVVGLRLVAVPRIDADDLLVLGEDGVPLPGAAAQEAIEVLEAPAGWPAIERSSRPLLPVRREVPLAERRRVVAVIAQDARQRRAIPRERGGVPRIAARELAHRPETDGVTVATGQQRGPRRRADGRHVEPVVAHAAVGHPGVVGGLDRAAECARVSEARVVDEHEQDVRRTVRGRRMTDEVPVGLRAGERPVDDAFECRASDGQVTSIDDGHDCHLLLVIRTWY